MPLLVDARDVLSVEWMSVEGSVSTMGGVLDGPTRYLRNRAGLKLGVITLMKTKKTKIGLLGCVQKNGKVCSCFSKVFPCLIIRRQNLFT